jgi:NADH:ubiquinone oxidoreductase subunit 2 (subunit N)
MALIAAFLSLLYSFRLFVGIVPIGGSGGFSLFNGTLFNGWLMVAIVLLLPLMVVDNAGMSSIAGIATLISPFTPTCPTSPSTPDSSLFLAIIATLPTLATLLALHAPHALLALPSLSFKALLFDLPFSNMASLLNSIAFTILLASYLSLYLNLGLECHLLILVSYIGSISLIGSNDWLTTLIAFELLNIAIYLLMALFRGTETATLKYLLFSAFLTMIFILSIGSTLMVLPLLFKLALFPFRSVRSLI